MKQKISFLILGGLLFFGAAHAGWFVDAKKVEMSEEEKLEDFENIMKTKYEEMKKYYQRYGVRRSIVEKYCGKGNADLNYDSNGTLWKMECKDWDKVFK